MTPESRRPLQPERERKIDRRFADVIEASAKKGFETGGCFVNFYVREDLLVATVYRPEPAVYSVFAQDKSGVFQNLVSGIEFSEPDDLVDERPKKVKYASAGRETHLIEFVKSYVDNTLNTGQSVMSDEHTEQEGKSNPEEFSSRDLSEGEVDLASALQQWRAAVPKERMDEMWKSIDFEDEMRLQGLADIDPKNLDSVTMAIAMVNENSTSPRRRRLDKTEKLFRKGLELEKTPAVLNAPLYEIENPEVKRFAQAVMQAVEGGRRQHSYRHKMFKVGHLELSIIRRIDPREFIVIARDKSKREGDQFFGTYFAYTDLVDLLQKKPTKFVISYKYPISLEEFTQELMQFAVALSDEVADRYIPEEKFEAGDEDYGDVREKLIQYYLRDTITTPPLPSNFSAKLWDRIYLEEAIRNAQRTDATTQSLAEITEGIGLVAQTGKRKRAENLNRAETLFREGLGITE